MKLEVKRNDETATVVLSGKVDDKTADLIHTALSQLLRERDLILRMEGVTDLSSTGLRMLFMLQRQAQDHQRQITLAGLSQEFQETMASIGFLEFFRIENTPEVLP